MKNARLIQVIETTLTLDGDGTPDSPFRIVTEYWSTEGTLLARVDPSAIVLAPEHPLYKQAAEQPGPGLR